jgi:hypothetical protein
VTRGGFLAHIPHGGEGGTGEKEVGGWGVTVMTESAQDDDEEEEEEEEAAIDNDAFSSGSGRSNDVNVGGNFGAHDMPSGRYPIRIPRPANADDDVFASTAQRYVADSPVAHTTSFGDINVTRALDVRAAEVHARAAQAAADYLKKRQSGRAVAILRGISWPRHARIAAGNAPVSTRRARAREFTFASMCGTVEGRPVVATHTGWSPAVSVLEVVPRAPAAQRASSSPTYAPLSSSMSAAQHPTRNLNWRMWAKSVLDSHRRAWLEPGVKALADLHRMGVKKSRMVPDWSRRGVLSEEAQFTTAAGSADPIVIVAGITGRRRIIGDSRSSAASNDDPEARDAIVSSVLKQVALDDASLWATFLLALRVGGVPAAMVMHRDRIWHTSRAGFRRGMDRTVDATDLRSSVPTGGDLPFVTDNLTELYRQEVVPLPDLSIDAREYRSRRTLWSDNFKRGSIFASEHIVVNAHRWECLPTQIARLIVAEATLSHKKDDRFASSARRGSTLPPMHHSKHEHAAGVQALLRETWDTVFGLGLGSTLSPSASPPHATGSTASKAAAALMMRQTFGDADSPTAVPTKTCATARLVIAVVPRVHMLPLEDSTFGGLPTPTSVSQCAFRAARAAASRLGCALPKPWFDATHRSQRSEPGDPVPDSPKLPVLIQNPTVFVASANYKIVASVQQVYGAIGDPVFADQHHHATFVAAIVGGSDARGSKVDDPHGRAQRAMLAVAAARANVVVVEDPRMHHVFAQALRGTAVVVSPQRFGACVTQDCPEVPKRFSRAPQQPPPIPGVTVSSQRNETLMGLLREDRKQFAAGQREGWMHESDPYTRPVWREI